MSGKRAIVQQSQALGFTTDELGLIKRYQGIVALA